MIVTVWVPIPTFLAPIDAVATPSVSVPLPSLTSPTLSTTSPVGTTPVAPTRTTMVELWPYSIVVFVPITVGVALLTVSVADPVAGSTEPSPE